MRPINDLGPPHGEETPINAMPEHPIEAVHQARDALEKAVVAQAHVREPAREDLHAYGSAIVATLSALGSLTAVLAEQLAHYDEDRVRQDTIADHPVEKLRKAAEHLAHLRDVLATATANANRYWSAITDLDEATLPDKPYLFERDSDSDNPA